MKIYAIADLHLSTSTQKPMDVFGWGDHWSKIKSDWLSKVESEDVVLIAGDISWAMTLEEVESDLLEVCSLPGHKIMIKGNHDFWHSSLSRTRAMLFNNTYFLQNDFVQIGDFVFAGTRGWKKPEDSDFTEHDQKIYNRELMRLDMSLQQAHATGKRLIGLMHYCPMNLRCATEFTDIFSKYNTQHVVYGHIHGKPPGCEEYSSAEIDGVTYSLTSCDYLNFELKLI